MSDSWIESLRLSLNESSNSHDVDQVKSKFLGKNGLVTSALKDLKNLTNDEKRLLGPKLNKLKNEISVIISQKYDDIKQQQIEDKLNAHYDTTLIGRKQWSGSRHPVTIAKQQLCQIMSQSGFMSQTGPEIETDEFNFDALNIPADHPARQDHDTFYLDCGRLLRTHTSPVQIRALKKQGAPIKLFSCGRVYRSDFDATHTPMFHQMEALSLADGVTFGHLKGMVHYLLNNFFDRDVEIRFRPAYFPFTEPSAEVDIRWGDKWLEVMGCGLVHPNVIHNVGLDAEITQGYAFGVGIDRLAMLKFGINDLRSMFENNQDMLRQFYPGLV